MKDWESLLPKLQDGRANPWDTCRDLIGIKVVVLSTANVDDAEVALDGFFKDPEKRKTPKWYEQGPSAKGYQALHGQLKIPEQAPVSANVDKTGAELQIVTAMQEAWGTSP